MRRSLPRCAWPAVVALLMIAAAEAHSQSPRPRQGGLKVGELAPDFSVKDVRGEQAVRLSDLKGKPAVLIFGSCT